jgi:tetratricopeptide (TPR) repeat protein
MFYRAFFLSILLSAGLGQSVLLALPSNDSISTSTCNMPSYDKKYERANTLGPLAQDTALSGDIKKALAIYDLSISISPDYALTYLLRASAKEKITDYNGAIWDYSEVISIDLQCSHAYFFRGLAKEKIGDYQGAILDFNKAIELDPKDSLYVSHRGYFREKTEKDYKGALSDYEKVIELEPNDASNYFSRAALREKIKDYRGAIEDYSQIVYDLQKKGYSTFHQLSEENLRGLREKLKE